jgi:hypothetical protein
MLGKLIKDIFAGDEAEAPVPTPAPTPAAAASQSQPQPPATPEFVPPHSASAYQGKIFITFIGDSRSDGLAAGAHALADITRAEGYDFRLIDVRKDTWRQEITDLMSRPEEVCCIFSSMGFADGWVAPHPSGPRSLWRETGIPFISGIGDHPAYFWDRHISRGPGFSSMYLFQEHVDAALAWMNPVPQMGLLPPWARDTVEKQEMDFGKKEAGEIYFFKNGNNPHALLEFWRGLPQPMSGWLLELIHSYDMLKLGRSLKPLHELVVDFLRDRQFYPGPPSWIQIFMVAQLDDYARRLKSTLIGEALLDLPVHVFGDNWGHVDFTGRRATHHEGQSYFKTRGLINNALALIDMSPNTESAPHDRFMAAIGRHTMCLNNTQQYYLDNYESAERMLFEFDAESIRQKVVEVMENPKAYVDYGVAVAERARIIHPPSAVVDRVVECARMTRFAGARSEFVGQQDFVNWPPTLR